MLWRVILISLITLLWVSSCAPQAIEPRTTDTPALIPTATPETARTVTRTPTVTLGTARTITLALYPAPTSCCGPEITRAVLALQKMPGYINFGLPPQVGGDGTRRFPIMTVTFDSSKISAEALVKIIADASGVTVTEVK